MCDRYTAASVSLRNQFDQDRLDVAAVFVCQLASKSLSHKVRLPPLGKDRNAVPGLLAKPYGAIAGSVDRLDRELILRRLQLLQANDVPLGLFKPLDEEREPDFDVVARKLHVLSLGRFPAQPSCESCRRSSRLS